MVVKKVCKQGMLSYSSELRLLEKSESKAPTLPAYEMSIVFYSDKFNFILLNFCL